MRTLAIFLLAMLLGVCLAQDTGNPPATFTLEDVLKLVRAGVTDDVVIARIKRYNRPFDLNSDEILELKKIGVSDTVVRYLLEPSQPYTPPAPPPPPSEVKPPAAPLKDPLMPKIPPDPGMYWLSRAEPGDEAFEFIELKPVVPLKPGSGKAGKMGKVGKMLPMKKGKALGFLVSAAAKLRVGPGAQVFYARLGPKIAIEDIVLLQMAKGDGRRTLDFGPKPDKPVFPADAIRPFDSKLLAEGLYRLNVGAIRPGEYIFLILGSGDEKKGILGKGYDFGTGAAGQQKP
jgi:hypothetical protein